MHAIHRARNLGAGAVGLIAAFLLVPSLALAAGRCVLPERGTGWQSVTVHSGGLDRKMRLYIPASAAGRSERALVFDLHGSGGSGEQQAQHSGLMYKADRHGFLLANPDGGIADPHSPGGHFFWHIPGVPLIGNLQTPANAPDDVQFFRDAIQQLEESGCVDPHRIYVTGFSGGARMASLLACELADRLAAIAPVAGLRAGVPSAGDFKSPDPKSCTPHRAVPIITFHGVHDPTNPFYGDGGPRWGYSVPAALQRWASLEACQSIPSEQRISTHVTEVRYSGCRDGTELILYRTDAPLGHGGGHIWPHPAAAGAQASVADAEVVDQLDASELIWEFFARHPS
jgi:polyhydroxybutyrate depolymerase